MTRRFGLNTLFLTETAATPAQLDRWLLETGAGATGHIWQIHQTLRHLDPQRVVLPALAGEVGRAYYWHRTDTATNTLSGTDLLARYELPAHERLVDAADRWLGGLKGHSTFEVLDLAYIEHRLGCWAGPQQYGSVPFGEHLLPFSHRRIFEAMLALPPAYKAEQRLAVDVCRRAWPELLEVPFNRIPGLRRYVKMIERIRADPSRVKGRIAEVAGRVRRR